jgi:hypothetical protein
MKQETSTGLRSAAGELPHDLCQAVAPVVAQLGETVRGVRIGPSKSAAEFLDLEGIRLRVAQEQGGRTLPGQANLVERLRTLPPGQEITYVILETSTRQAKCYVDTHNRQLFGVLWLPVAAGESAAELRNDS